MTSLRLGSLFSGFGALDLAVENVFGATTTWVSDIEPGPCKVLAHRFPHAPNLGDITKVDWTQVEPVDIIAGGSPCQDISSAGRMAGMREGTRSNLWAEMRDAICILRPRYVVWENVGAARSTAAASAMESDPGLLGDHPAGLPVLRALGRVLGDLASLGYMGRWYGLRAADVGAPHGRLRFFVLAAASRVGHKWSGTAWAGRTGLEDRGGGPVALLPTPMVGSSSLAAHGQISGQYRDAMADALANWERYAPAIARWESLTRPAPAPTKLGRSGSPKLNPRFAEWMMGAADGWITDVPGVTDNEALRMAGNGVVQLQAEAALRLMLTRMEAVA